MPNKDISVEIYILTCHDWSHVRGTLIYHTLTLSYISVIHADTHMSYISVIHASTSPHE